MKILRTLYYTSRQVFIFLIAWQPISFLRPYLYNLLPENSIVNTRIGWGTLINVHEFVAKDSNIGGFNKFVGPAKVTLEGNNTIGNGNKFICYDWASQTIADPPYGKELVLKYKAWITSNHYFDLVGRIEIGRSTTIAGYSSQFWTHGIGVTDRNVKIGDCCYIGSSCLFSPGSEIAENTLVQLGTTIVGKFTENFVIIANDKSKIIKSKSNWSKSFNYIN